MLVMFAIPGCRCLLLRVIHSCRLCFACCCVWYMLIAVCLVTVLRCCVLVVCYVPCVVCRELLCVGWCLLLLGGVCCRALLLAGCV